MFASILNRIAEDTLIARRAYFENGGETATPTRARRSAAITAAATLIPGPVGALTVPAETLMVLREKLALVADIAWEHDALEQLTPRRMLALTFDLDAKPTHSYLDRPRTADRAVLGHAARTFAARWMPVVGGVAATVKTLGETRDLASRCHEVFAGEASESAPVKPTRPDELPLSSSVEEGVYLALLALARDVSPPSKDQIADLERRHVALRKKGLAKGLDIIDPHTSLASESGPTIQAALFADRAHLLALEEAVQAFLAEGPLTAVRVEALESLATTLGLQSDHFLPKLRVAS